MSNRAWECPRCRRINAPFNPTCFCNPEKGLKGLATEILERVHNRANPNMAAHCNDCGEMLNGLTRHICKVSM